MNMYELSVPHFDQVLQNMEKWIDKAQAHATAKKFDANTLLQARLAPDMFPLIQQLWSACDNAKFACARVCGKEAPKHPDTEKTFDELRTRIRSVREYVSSFKPADFEGAEDRKCVLPWMPGKHMIGKDYLTKFALMNFAFHASMAYAILRHNGVDVGKADFMGTLPFRDG